MIGTNPSDSYNLNPQCPIHGPHSEFYNSPEQVKRREERSKRLREWAKQKRA
jgi:hypothetical protein